MPSNKCKRCRRILKDPVSIDAGLGPVCRSKVAFVATVQRVPPLEPFATVGLVCQRAADGTALVNLKQTIVRHSPTGFEWGYGGSGPADLALNVLAAVIGQRLAEAGGLYQNFKRDLIETMPREGGRIPLKLIRDWLTARGFRVQNKLDASSAPAA